MYGQNSGSGSGTGTPRPSFQPGPHSRNPRTGRMENQQEQPHDSFQDESNNPTQEPTPQTSQEPQYNGSYVVVPPNQSKREKLLTMSNKELEDYDRFRESRRLGPIYLNPEKLGGETSEEKARQQQQRTQSQSKYQKQFQRDEYKRKQREEEEAKVQQMKEIQRKKAERLEEKRRQEDIERKERWHKHMSEKRSEFLDKLSQPANDSSSYPSYGVMPSERSSADEEEYNWNRYTELDEERTLQQVLKESMKTKNEEDQKREKLEKKQPWQNLGEERRRQVLEKTELLQASKPSYTSYKQQLKREEERNLQKMKEEQRRKSELLEVKKAEEEKERKLSQQEEHRRVNKAFLDRLQRQQEYSGESNTWA